MNQFSSHTVMQQGNSLRESFSSLQHMPGIAVVKDLKSEFTTASNFFAHFAGWKNADQCEGKSDYDIPCEVNKVADLFVQRDQKVIQSGKELLNLTICEYASGWTSLISTTKPILNNNGVITGVFVQAIDISKTNMFKWRLSLTSTDHSIVGKANKQNIYTLNDENSPLPLTPRQQSFLFLFVRGKSVKEIAAALGISVRTAEEYITTIKEKLMCTSRSQVIEKAINSGFLNFIPQDVLYNESML